MSSPQTKRLIVLCDGTWLNSDTTNAIPSNITRLHRCIPPVPSTGPIQITSYQSGVGSGSNILDALLGGFFGSGISERIREVYSFLCANYAPGDEIVLAGFSRGAFTARCVAGMISGLGLLTGEGMAVFSAVFEDMCSWGEEGVIKDSFPGVPFKDKPCISSLRCPDMPEPTYQDVAAAYKAKLLELGLTRTHYTLPSSSETHEITIHAIAVFDTVGSLGIPQSSLMHHLGLQPSHRAYQFYDTSLTPQIKHAFQALALDETRPPFSPAVWERSEQDELACDLRQVWFPGSHANVGGGWADQEIADLALAWMMDQLGSVGVVFDFEAVQRVFDDTRRYFEGLDEGDIPPLTVRKTLYNSWVTSPVTSTVKPRETPLRPWACGKISTANSPLYALAGTITRSPGMYHRVNPANGSWKSTYLQRTNERIHSSVRVRLQCEGLGLNDKGIWTCPALSGWHLENTDTPVSSLVPRHPSWLPTDWKVEDSARGHLAENNGWIWRYQGTEKLDVTVMPEEPIGPIERRLLYCFGGAERKTTYEFAQNLPMDEIRQPPLRKKSTYRELWNDKKGWGITEWFMGFWKKKDKKVTLARAESDETVVA